MADKHPERDRLAGPFHSFRVVHVIRPGGHAAGGSEISTGHLSPAAARDWISQVAKDHKISQREPIDPAHGVPAGLVEQLGLAPSPAAERAAQEWEQGQLDGQDAAAASGREEASRDDD